MASKESEGQGASKAGKIKAQMVGLKNYLYNPTNKTVLDRTCISWAKITLFYIVYYACLAGFWAAMLMAFFVTIEEDQPKLQNYDSLIKYNPGMGYRPQPDVDYTLVQFNQGDVKSYEPYTKNLDKYLDQYANQTEKGLIKCDPSDPANEYRDPNRACQYPISHLGQECTKERNYGYDVGMPCVLLKMNKLFNWKPEPMKNSSIPDDLKPFYKDGFVGVTCEGKNHADTDNMGPVEFYPSAGFDASYFPYTNQKGYLAPIVMARFTRLRPGTLVIVYCKIWGNNIYHDKNDRAGSVHFELLMD